jgi:hypothetical protein
MDRRGSIWVDWRFQVLHTVRMVGIALALLVVLFALYVRALGEQTKLLGLTRPTASPTATTVVGDAADAAAAFDEELRARARSEDSIHLMALGAVALALLVLLTMRAIRVTFRIAGPVRAVSGMMHAMAKGELNGLRRLRHGDAFVELEDAVFAVRDAWCRTALEDADLVRRLADRLRASSESGEGDPTIAGLVREADHRVTERFARFECD